MSTQPKKSKAKAMKAELTIAGKTYAYDYDFLELQQATLAVRTYEHRSEQLQRSSGLDVQDDIDNDGTFASLRAVAYVLKEKDESGQLLPFDKVKAETVVLDGLKRLSGQDNWNRIEEIKKNFFMRHGKQLLQSVVDSPFEQKFIAEQQKSLWEAFVKAQQQEQIASEENSSATDSTANEPGMKTGTKN